MRFFSRPGPQARQRSGADQPVGWAGLRRFFVFWRGGDMGRKCGLWPHSDKTGGSQRGAWPPLWHTALLARCSVLYLLARLTGEAGGGAVCPRLHRQENGLGFCDREGAKSQSVFRERRQVYKPPVPPSFVPRRAGTKCPKGGGSCSPKYKRGRQAPLGLACLDDRKARPGGTVNGGALVQPSS